MSPEFILKRYAAYYKGWCQTFGEHEGEPGEDTDINWLFGEQQVGFISPRNLTRQLFLEILRKHDSPTLTISRNSVQIGAFEYERSTASDEAALLAIKNMLETGQTSHIYLTSHFMYGTSTRIVTVSNKKPLSIIYKDIGTLRIRLR